MTTYAEALCAATAEAMDLDPDVFVMGIGVDGEAGVFGSTRGLVDRFGPKRVFDGPISEAALTGLAMGAAAQGMRPILVHQRVDFALYSVDQIVNHIASTRFVSGGKMTMPIVIRLIVGKGWGQGPQHSKALYSWFAHVPGLKVVTPCAPADAKGLLTSAILSDDPVIFIEGRELYALEAEVDPARFATPIGRARRYMRPSPRLTIVAYGPTVPLALDAAERLNAEVVDLRTLAPLDIETVLDSVAVTGRLAVVEGDWTFCGMGAEVVAQVVERILLKQKPIRIGWPHSHAPTSVKAEAEFHPTVVSIVAACRQMDVGGFDGRQADRRYQAEP